MKKMFSFLMIFFLISLLFFNCGKKKDNHITILMWGQPEEVKAVDNFIEKFNQIYPDIEVERLHVSEYYNKLQTMIAAGTPPDVMYMGSEYFPTYAIKGALMDLTPYLVNDPDTKTEKFQLNNYFKEVMDPFKHEGKYYGIAKDFTTMVLYYNKDLFDREGLKYPDKNWTWEDLKRTAIALTKKNSGGITEQFGFLFESWVGYWVSWIRQNGGEIFDEKSKQYVIGKEPYLSKNVETLQFIYDMMYKYHACPTIEESQDLGASRLMETGKVAMVTYGRWRVLELKNVKTFKWDCAILPKEKTRASTLFTVCYSIAKDSKNKLAAWKLLKFLVGKEGQVNTAESCLAIPSLKSVAYSEHFFKPKDLALQINAVAYLEQLPYSKPMPAHEKAQEFNDLIKRYLDEIFISKKPVRETLVELQKEIDSM
ncbi:MAG: sugar ABC transporter substrate-binding protein [Spirochaetes bacterium]|nr:sugar ABC transporter substrate-binding protein [Spirochaetota bacterium]